ncbi:MAG: hypothetical protein IJ083_09715 [Clostridia bacterium]|nr:hypothetical protein [Clostridia bacterium]
MNPKEKAIRRMSEKFSEKSVPWWMGGDYLQVHLQKKDAWHTLEVHVRAEDRDKADRILTRLGMRQEDGTHLSFHFDGTDVDLVADLPALSDAELTLDTVTVQGAPVPLLNLPA